MIFERTYDSDSGKTVKIENLSGSTFTGENGAHTFRISALTGTIIGTITAYMIRSNGTTCTIDGTNDDGVAIVTLNSDCYNVPGRFTLSIFAAVEDTSATCIYACVGTVVRTTTDAVVDSGDIISISELVAKQAELEQDVADATSAVTSAQNAVAYLAPTFSTSKTYSVGEYVTKDGALYICTTAVTTAGAWNASNWTSATFGGELGSLQSATAELAADDYVALATPIQYTGKYIDYQSGWAADSSLYNSTDYIPVGMFAAIKYKRCGTNASSTLSGIAFYGAAKNFLGGIPSAWNQAQTGYLADLQLIGIPTGAAYVRCSLYADSTTYGSFALYGVTQIGQTVRELKSDTFVDAPFLIAESSKYIVYTDGTTGSQDTYSITNYIDVERFGEISYKRTGTTYSSTSAGVAFYDATKTYLPNSGISGATSQSAVGYVSALYTVKVPEGAKYVRFTTYADRITYGFFELYGKTKQACEIDALQSQLALVDGSQWRGKTWYGYGTSITNTSSEGRYPTYLAQMSGMTFVNKGISGGGIGDLGAYAHGQVYDAICNVTDGKLNADLITLETGANDVRAEVPLGTIYDTGTTTLAGCLNDCIRYLQANTNAQICIINSPASTTEPAAANKYYEWADMVRQICDINRVHFLNNNSNMGYAKIADATKGSMYVVDSIHQTNLGGFIMAQNLWCQLRNIPLFYTAIPT